MIASIFYPLGIGSIFYPLGIGKHIVCIYADLSAAAKQTACRGEPRAPKKRTGEIKYSG